MKETGDIEMPQKIYKFCDIYDRNGNKILNVNVGTRFGPFCFVEKKENVYSLWRLQNGKLHEDIRFIMTDSGHKTIISKTVLRSMKYGNYYEYHELVKPTKESVKLNYLDASIEDSCPKELLFRHQANLAVPAVTRMI